MASALPKSNRDKPDKQKTLNVTVENTTSKSQLSPLSPWTDAEATGLFHDSQHVSDDNILNVRIHSSPTRKEARQIARCISDYYLYLSEVRDIDPRGLLIDLAHIAELFKPLLQQDKNGHSILERAITDDQENELSKLRQEIEGEYMPLITDTLLHQAELLLKAKPMSYEMAMETAFTKFGSDISIASGALRCLEDDFDTSRWGRLIPNFLGPGIDSVMRRLDNVHSEMQRFVYLELGDEQTKLWYLIWQNLKTIWMLFKEHDSVFESADYLVESHFFRVVLIQALFEHVKVEPEFMNLEIIKNIVAFYCACVHLYREARGVRSEQLRGWDPEQPISNEASSELIKQISSYTWEPKARPALQWAVIRFNHLTGGPTIVRRHGRIVECWSAGIDGNSATVVEQLIPESSDRDGTQSSDDLPAGSPNSNAKTRSLGPVEYPKPYGRNITVAYDYVYYPNPENRAQEVAESRRITRDLRDPGIISDGPRIEDCINLPPPHVRPPGTYTGHKRRRGGGPLDYLKLFGKELIRWVAWQPYPTRKVSIAPPSITTRASCRQRKIEKEVRRTLKTQRKKHAGSKSAASGLVHDPRIRVTKSGRLNSTTTASPDHSKISTVPRLRGGGSKGPDSVLPDPSARIRERAPGSPTPLPRQTVCQSNAHGAMGLAHTDTISASRSIDTDSDEESIEILEDNASPERHPPSNQENTEPTNIVAQVPAARNPLQERTLVEAPAEATGNANAEAISIASTPSSHYTPELDEPDCHPCPTIQGQWHHICHKGDCPAAKEFARWLRKEVAHERRENPWQRMQQEGFGPYFARAHATDQPQSFGQVDDTANDTGNTDGGRNNQLPDNPYVEGSGPEGIFLGALIDSIRYSTLEDAENALKELRSRGVTKLGKTIIDDKEVDNVSDAGDELTNTKENMTSFAMSYLPNPYYERRFLAWNSKHPDFPREDAASPEAPRDNMDQQSQMQVKHEEDRPAPVDVVIINGLHYIDRDVAEEEFIVQEANPAAFQGAIINGLVYYNLTEARNALDGMWELLSRAEPIQPVPRHPASQHPEGEGEVPEAPAHSANYILPLPTLHMRETGAEEYIATEAHPIYGQQLLPIHHVRDYDAEDPIEGESNNNIGLEYLQAWQNGLAADEAGPERDQPQQPRISNRQPAEITPDQEQLQHEQREAIERNHQLDAQPDQEVVAEEEPETRAESEASVGERRGNTTPSQSPFESPAKKRKKPHKAGKRTAAEVVDLIKETGELSPQDVNRRTRAQRRMAEIKQEEVDEADEQNQDDQANENEKDKKKKGKGKGPKNTTPTQDKPNNDDDDDSDNNDPDGADPATEPRRATRAKAAPKAKPAKKRAATQKAGKGRAGAKAGKKRSHIEITDNDQSENIEELEQLATAPAIVDFCPFKKPRLNNTTSSIIDTPPKKSIIIKSQPQILLPNIRQSSNHSKTLRPKPLTNYNPDRTKRMLKKVRSSQKSTLAAFWRR